MKLIEVISYGSKRHLNADAICWIEPSGEQTLVNFGGYTQYVDVRYEDFVALIEDIYRSKPEPTPQSTNAPAQLAIDASWEYMTNPRTAIPSVDSVGNVALNAIDNGYSLSLNLKPERKPDND